MELDEEVVCHRPTENEVNHSLKAFSLKCSLKINDNHKNAVGAVMGGVPFMLADFAFAVAANHQEPKSVSLNSTITFLGVAKGEKLIAEANCIKNGRSTCYYSITVCDDLNNLVAEVNITGFNKQ